MAREKKSEFPIKKSEPYPVSPVDLSRPSETKVRFLVWFTGALDRFEGLKAHHLHSVRAYFTDLGLSEPETIEVYDLGLIKFGLKRRGN